jgi:positive regulator of sigma E activity
MSRTGDRATVAIVKPDDTTACERCAHSFCCSTTPSGPRTFDVRTAQELDPGQLVTVELELASPAWAAFLLFMAPMAAAFAAGVVVHQLTGHAALGLAAGIAGAACAYLVVYLTSAQRGPQGILVGTEPESGNRPRGGDAETS